MNRRSFLKTTSTAGGAAAAGSKVSTPAIGQSVQAGPTFRRPKIILPVPTPEAKFQHVEDGVPDTSQRESFPARMLVVSRRVLDVSSAPRKLHPSVCESSC